LGAKKGVQPAGTLPGTEGRTRTKTGEKDSASESDDIIGIFAKESGAWTREPDPNEIT